MPFIYIHTPFPCTQTKRDKLMRSISRTLLGKCKEWNLKEAYIHFAFTEELKSLEREKRAIMVRAECCEHPYTLEKKDIIASYIKESIQVIFSREEIRCLFSVLPKETTGFSTSEYDRCRY